MVTPTMHKRFDYHMDTIASPRLDRNDHKDQALNTAMEKVFNTLVDTFQIEQYIRDEMRPLVKFNQPVSVASNVIALPADYRHLLSMSVVIGGVTIEDVRLVDYAEYRKMKDNSLTAPDATHPVVIESDAGLTVDAGSGVVVSSVRMDYIRRPKQIFYSKTTVSFGPSVLTTGTMYYVETGPVVHNSITYNAGLFGQPGDTFTAVNAAFTGGGTVSAIQNCEIGETAHEEICKIAAAIQAGINIDLSRFQIKAMEGRR